MPSKDLLELIGEDLRDPAFAAHYLEDCLEDGLDTFLVALRDVARANGGVSGVSRAASLSRESLYRALSESGNPEIRTVQAILKAVGLRLSIAPDTAARAA